MATYQSNLDALKSSVSVGVWSGLKPEVSPHALTTYWPGSSLPAGYVEVDPPVNLTVALAGDQLKLTLASRHPSDPGTIAIAVAVPTGSQWMVTTEFQLEGQNSDFSGGGAFVSGDIVGDVANAPWFGVGVTLRDGAKYAPTPDPTIEAAYRSDWATFTDTIEQFPTSTPVGPMYHRIWVDPTAKTVASLVSITGESFQRIGDVQAWASVGLTTIDYAGVSMSNGGQKGAVIGTSRMCRFNIGATLDAFTPCGGLV